MKRSLSVIAAFYAFAPFFTGGVYVGWRMMGYEYDKTASNVAYNLYRDGTKIATVTDSTNYLDASGTTIGSGRVINPSNWARQLANMASSTHPDRRMSGCASFRGVSAGSVIGAI